MVRAQSPRRGTIRSGPPARACKPGSSRSGATRPGCCDLSMSKMATCSSRNLESPFERADRMNSRSGHARTTESKSHSSQPSAPERKIVLGVMQQPRHGEQKLTIGIVHVLSPFHPAPDLPSLSWPRHHRDFHVPSRNHKPVLIAGNGKKMIHLGSLFRRQTGIGQYSDVSGCSRRDGNGAEAVD